MASECLIHVKFNFPRKDRSTQQILSFKRREKPSHTRGKHDKTSHRDGKWLRQSQVVSERFHVFIKSNRQYTECIKYIIVQVVLRMPEEASKWLTRESKVKVESVKYCNAILKEFKLQWFTNPRGAR